MTIFQALREYFLIGFVIIIIFFSRSIPNET